jgi:LysR family glycine cleavage system transcriptional activator
MIQMPSIACLQAFECIARYASVTRASQELNLTQSAVSRQICQLESLLDVSLFERVRQRLVMTDAGKLYLNDVRTILSSLHSMSANLGSPATFGNATSELTNPRLAQFYGRFEF